MSVSIPMMCDDCKHEYAISENDNLHPQYCVYVPDQTLSYLKVYCPNCKVWGRQFGRRARAVALELNLNCIYVNIIDKPHVDSRNSWMARHGYDVDRLSDEMLDAINPQTLDASLGSSPMSSRS